MAIRPEVLPYILISVVLAALLTSFCQCLRVSMRRSLIAGGLVGLVLIGFMLNFFRDPTRIPPDDASLVVSGADGRIMGVRVMDEPDFFGGETVRISIFLSLVDVHVNRAPIAGRVTHLDYVPGKRHFTFREESSDYNQHSTILIESPELLCMVKQIVGPIARRVVYWLEEGQDLAKGERIGMMKFGSRLDMYFPSDRVEVLVAEGDRVSAGETVVARILEHTGRP